MKIDRLDAVNILAAFGKEHDKKGRAKMAVKALEYLGYDDKLILSFMFGWGWEDNEVRPMLSKKISCKIDLSING